MVIIEAQKPRSTTLLGGRTLFATVGTVDLEKNPPCNAKDNLRAGSSSLKPGSGATEGVLDKGVSGQPDYILWPDCWTVKIQD